MQEAWSCGFERRHSTPPPAREGVGQGRSPQRAANHRPRDVTAARGSHRRLAGRLPACSCPSAGPGTCLKPCPWHSAACLLRPWRDARAPHSGQPLMGLGDSRPPLGPAGRPSSLKFCQRRRSPWGRPPASAKHISTNQASLRDSPFGKVCGRPVRPRGTQRSLPPQSTKSRLPVGLTLQTLNWSRSFPELAELSSC